MAGDATKELSCGEATSPSRGGRFGIAALADDGTLELVKWIALSAMLVDHVGRYLLHQPPFSLAYQIGRVAFPLFAFVLAYKLSRRAETDGRVSLRTVKRLLLWALISAAPYHFATGQLWAMNIFFTLALGALLCWLSQAPIRRRYKLLAQAGIFFASFGCDYLAPGVFLIFSVFSFYRQPRVRTALAVLACGLALAFINWSAFTLLAFPLALLPHLVRLKVPRLRWFFYAFYPAHLLLIASLAQG